MELHQLSKFLPFELIIIVDLLDLKTQDLSLDSVIVKDNGNLIIQFLIDFFETSKVEKINKVNFYNFVNKAPITGIYKRVGWYVIFNKKNSTFYVGSSIQLGKRKSQHELDLKNYFSGKDTLLLKTLLRSIEQDDCNVSDLVFIPFSITGSTLPIEFGNVREKIPLKILRKYVELVEIYIIQSFKKDFVYNELICNDQVETSFVETSPLSICEIDGLYAWPSLNECANFFGVNKRIIYNRIQKNIHFKELTSEEFSNWKKEFILSKKNDTNFSGEIFKTLKSKYFTNLNK